MDRNQAAQHITNLIEDLTIQLLITEHYTYDPTHAHGEWANQPLPKRHPIHLKRTDPPLVTQLADLEKATLTAAGSHEPIKRTKPGSQPPINLDMYDTLERLTRDTQYWRDLYTLHKGQTPKPTPIAANITHLRHIALDPHTPDQLVTTILRGLRKYRNQALIVLGYVSPMVTFPGYYCHICHGALRARADATTDMYCAGGSTVDPPYGLQGCGNRYGRGAWAEILATKEDEGAA